MDALEALFLTLMIGGMAGLTVSQLVRRPDRRAAKVDGGEHREMFVVRSATAPAWSYIGGLGARVDLYDEAIIVTSTPPGGWTMRRSEIREITRTRAGVVALGMDGSKLVRAHDHAWLGTSADQHELLVRWLAGELPTQAADETNTIT